MKLVTSLPLLLAKLALSGTEVNKNFEIKAIFILKRACNSKTKIFNYTLKIN